MKLSLMTFMEEIPLLVKGEAFDEDARRDFAALLSDAAEAGFSCVDLIGASILRYGTEETAALLKQHGLLLNCVICMGPFERAMTQEIFDSVIRPQIDAARALGAPLVMLVPGSNDEEQAAIREHLTENFKRAVACAAEFQKTCAIEDFPLLNLQMCRADDLLSLTEAVPGLKIVFDTANVLLVREDPVLDCKKLIGQTVHLHLKDICEAPPDTPGTDRTIDGVTMKGCPHGSGRVDFADILKALREKSYEGPAAIEYAPQEGVTRLAEFRRLHRMFSEYEMSK